MNRKTFKRFRQFCYHQTMRLTPEELEKVRAEFFISGQSVADWARANHCRQELVYAVLSGRSKATRGESHRIAVKLGLKANRSNVAPVGAEDVM